MCLKETLRMYSPVPRYTTVMKKKFIVVARSAVKCLWRSLPMDSNMFLTWPLDIHSLDFRIFGKSSNWISAFLEQKQVSEKC